MFEVFRMSPKKQPPSEPNSHALASETGHNTEETTSAIPLTVVIGGSAGALESLQQLFTGMPAGSGHCFVVLVHHPPDGPSLLTGVLARYTSMEVVTAAEGMPLRPNTVYVIPPAGGLTFSSGRFEGDDGVTPDRKFYPIDRLLQSLASQAGTKAIAVILTGSGSDGVRGAKAIKQAGGIVVVQDPASALYSDMPQSAIDAGAADLVLDLAMIPGAIAEMADGSSLPAPLTSDAGSLAENLAAIFAIVKARSGHDFSSYKRNTIMRRIERRMTVHQAEGLESYLDFLDANPQESQDLARDILIGDTQFFRDPEAFEILAREIIPRIFAGRDPEDPVRIWHAGCSTGEEVYSMAILIQEYLTKRNLSTRVQVFATDIDEAAVSRARAGSYPDGIAADLEEERLRRFFIRSGDRWQVSKQLREMVVFAHHNLIMDPPFSRLDLLVCRNFLIYLNSEIQKRLIPLFHQVLKPGGFLFLGPAETVGHQSGLFSPIDKKWKIFIRQEGERPVGTLFPFSGPLDRHAGARRTARSGEALQPGPVALAEKHLLERYVPARVIVNEKYEVVYYSSRTGAYLETPQGEPTRDFMRMAREELRPALRAALYKAFTEKVEVVFRGTRLMVNGAESALNIIVAPLSEPPPAAKLALVIFEPAAPPVLPAAPGEGDGCQGEAIPQSSLVRQLEEQLRVTYEQLQIVSEHLETSNEGFLSANEEMMSVNEELQSTNEELHSTNEELETSKEELQALNEELSTVNAELVNKVEEQKRTEAALRESEERHRLLAETMLQGVVHQDAAGRIITMNPAAEQILGKTRQQFLGSSSVREEHDTIRENGDPFPGREHPAMVALATGKEVHKVVMGVFNPQLQECRWISADAVPVFRAGDFHPSEVYTVFEDITEKRTVEKALRENEQRVSALINSASESIWLFGLNGEILAANATAARRMGLGVKDLVGKNYHDFLRPDLVRSRAERIDEVLRSASPVYFEDERGGICFDHGAYPVFDEIGKVAAIAVFSRDVTQRRRIEEALRAQTEDLESFNSAAVGRELRMIELKREVNDLCCSAGLSPRYELDVSPDQP
jgi:two-component system CheB/CheR fusion protein